MMASRRNRYESGSKGKEGKRGKGKKWKEINKKGETKEGGDMDAFLDKREVINQVITVRPVSPTSISAVAENIPPNEGEMDSLGQELNVAEKNEENIRVSMELDKESNEVSDSHIDSSLKYNYQEDQWSPINPEGKKKYDRAFLLNMQEEPFCLQKPKNLPPVEIVKEKVILHKLPDNSKPAVTPTQPRNYSDPFIPIYYAPRQTRPPPSGVGRRQSQQGRDKPKKIISSSFNQDVKLHESENAWKPEHHKKAEEDSEDTKTQELYKKVRGILNKLTPQKFQTLVEQVKQLPISTEERLKGVIDLVFEKAIDEPNFSVPYANMCKHVSVVSVPSSTGSDKLTNFRKLLLTKCQHEFEKDKNDEINYTKKKQLIEQAVKEEEKKQLSEELEEEKRKSRQRSLGNIKFIGELFKLNMLTASIMHECVKKLLLQRDEDSLECLCRLLTTIGKELEAGDKNKTPAPKSNTTSAQVMSSYFETLKQVVEQRHTSSRVRFMLQDVIELRQNNWIPRRDENNPKTIDQIHREAHREAQEQQQLLQIPFQKRSVDDRSSNRKGRGSTNYQDDGWLPSSKPKAGIDPSKLKVPKSTGESDILLGRGFAKWGQGSSGGNIKNTNQEVESKSTMLTNRFSALAAAEAAYSSYEPRRGSQRSAASSRESSRSGGNHLPPPPVRKTSSQTSTKERKQTHEIVKDITKLDSQVHKQSPVPSAIEKPSNEVVLRGIDLSEDEVERKTKAIVDEFLHNHDFEEAVLCIVETFSISSSPLFVLSAISQVLERSSQSRHLIGQLMHHLVKRKILPTEQYIKGLKSVLETAEDCAIDVPKIWQYLGELIQPMIQDNTISLAFLKDAAEPCIKSGIAGKLISEVLHEAAKHQGTTRIAQQWQIAGLQWSDFLAKSEDVLEFVKQNKLEYTISSVETPCVIEQLSYSKIKEKLDGFLHCKADNEEIFDWIDVHIGENVKEQKFIRALTTSLVESAIEGEVSLSIFEKKKLLPRLPLLQRYDRNSFLELHVLYALQALVNQLEHPKGLLHSLVEYFSEVDLISDEVFLQWEQSTDPAEQEGKGVALKSITQFITWIKEQDDDSLEDN